MALGAGNHGGPRYTNFWLGEGPRHYARGGKCHPFGPVVGSDL